MYAGEVNVAQDQLPQFLKTAERLKVCPVQETPSSACKLTFSCRR
jgi:hypothetical protein